MKHILFQLLSIVLVFVLFFSFSGTAYAAEMKTNEENIVIDGNTIVPLYQNYYNPDTGEYFIWNLTTDRAGTVAKSFSFKIQYSVTSSNFVINSNSVRVSATAHIEDKYGIESTQNNGHKYSIELNRLLSTKKLQFAIGGTESGKISGLSSGKKYYLRIVNNDSMSKLNYLVGSGTVTNL